MATPLILQRGDPSRQRENDYDVLKDGKVVGRIFHLAAAAPPGRPWIAATAHDQAWRARLRGDTRGRDGGVRKELAAPVVSAEAAMTSW